MSITFKLSIIGKVKTVMHTGYMVANDALHLLADWEDLPKKYYCGVKKELSIQLIRAGKPLESGDELRAGDTLIVVIR